MIIVSILLGLVIGAAYMGLMRAHYIARMFVFPLGFLVFLGCQYFSVEVAKVVSPDVSLHLEPLLM